VKQDFSMSDPLTRTAARSGDPDNPSPDELREIVASAKTIAVVGVSRDPVKAARRVPSYLSTKGFEIIPVNPHAEQILGRSARPSLEEVPEPVDIVLVFRPSADAAPVLTEASHRPERPVVWLQEGIRADREAAEARSRGITVVQDLCIFKIHRMLGERAPAGN
jgi:uncharacterized protein